MSVPNYELIRNNTWGRLRGDYVIQTPIVGYEVDYAQGKFHCRLEKDGRLAIYSLTEWDFGSGAMDTPAMVAASLVHDAFCHMTNAGKLPWSVRAQADRYFPQMLRDNGPRGGAFRWRTGLTYLSSSWRWLAVSANSQLLARWSARKYVPRG